jgi:hypothetical protein
MDYIIPAISFYVYISGGASLFLRVVVTPEMIIKIKRLWISWRNWVYMTTRLMLQMLSG